jgi:hypothetical protein
MLLMGQGVMGSAGPLIAVRAAAAGLMGHTLRTRALLRYALLVDPLCAVRVHDGTIVFACSPSESLAGALPSPSRFAATVAIPNL